MTRFALTIEYDGAPFMGLQRQPTGPTVQAAIEAAVLQITGEAAPFAAAGRTDAGVHALRMRVQLDIHKVIAPFRLMEALNALLRPAPIAVLDCVAVRPLARAVFVHRARVSVQDPQSPRAADLAAGPRLARQARA